MLGCFLLNIRAGGYEQLVRGEPMRAKFRHSWTHSQPMTPNEVTPINFEMPDVNHTFLRGHIMVQIQSSWFPLTDLNPQKFIDPAKAKRLDFMKGTERVYHTPGLSSSIGREWCHKDSGSAPLFKVLDDLIRGIRNGGLGGRRRSESPAAALRRKFCRRLWQNDYFAHHS